MANPNTRTIGTGKNHPDLKDFATWLSTRDLVANDEYVIAEVYQDQTTTQASTSIVPATYDATHYCIIRPAAGLGHADLDNSGALDYGTQGIQLSINHSGQFRVGNGVELTGFRILIPDGGSAQTTQIALNISRNANNASKPNGVFDAALTHCKIKCSSQVGTTRVIYTGEFAGAARITDNLIIQDNTAGAGSHVYMASLAVFERNTFVRRNSASGNTIANFVSSTITVRDNVFVNGGTTPITKTAQPATCSNNYCNSGGGTTITGVTYDTVNQFLINPASDCRPYDTGPLISAASTYSQNKLDVRGNNRGLSPDVGGAQLSAALPFPAGVVTNINVSGQTVTVSGTTTGSPSGATASLTVAAVADNPGVAQTSPASITLGTGTFSIQFTNVPSGIYTPAINFVNASGNADASNSVGNATVAGPTVTITSQTLSGQELTVSGTTTGTPTSGVIYVAGVTPVTITLGSGTFSAVLSGIPAGTYTGPKVVVTNATGSSFPASGGSAFTILGIDGQPASPEISEGGSSTVTSVAISPANPMVAGGNNQQFSATVSGTNSPLQSVAWSASAGTIDANGLFIAPAATGSLQTITITATSFQDSTKSGTTVVSIPASGAPAVAISSSSIALSTISATGTVDLGADAAASLNGYIEASDGSNPSGPFAISTAGGSWSFSRTVPGSGDWRLRIVAFANSKSVSDVTPAYSVLSLTGSIQLPT